MSPTMAMTMPAAMYNPTSDVMDRHEYGITKSRKSSSTGGGRAWSEDEVRDLEQDELLGGASELRAWFSGDASRVWAF